MQFNDKTLVQLIEGCEKKAAMILAGRQTIGYRDAAMNVVNMLLNTVTEQVNRVADMRKVSGAWRREVEFYERLQEKAQWVLSVYKNAQR